MFRIVKGYESIAKTIRIPIPLAENIENLAAKNNISFNQLVIQCLKYAIDNLLDDESKKSE